ncbi:MAG: 2-oxoacid:acceptor oxidoreductase subunit alpha [Pseudomonadota bacterium]
MQPLINDFVIKIATVNGTGSASANGLLLKALFRMGIPVVGKNYFPSNIQGLPTWYEIRVTRDGHMARAGHIDLMVALNVQTYQRDMAELEPGGVLIYDSTWPRNKVFDRDDISILGVPLSQLCNEHFDGARSRILLKNIAYVGVLTALLDIDRDVVTGLLDETYGAKPKLLDANREAIALGYDYAREHFECPWPTMRVEPMDKTAGHIMIDGNTAAGLGAVYAGATVGAWYPITPSTSLMDAFKAYCEKLRIDENGDRKFCIIQAEDELSAIGMVLGASWAGARAFTPTSGPGVSLMSEFIGFAYYSETPAVIWDVQRVGPSTGMPTRTQQSDLISAAYASHGDTRHVCLYPADPGECFSFAPVAFDLAERLQTPVIVLSDLDIGMNDWMCPAFEWDDNYVPDRGKVLSKDEIEALPRFHRYLDNDGDGIAPRTLPGESSKGAYFTRGSGHNRFGAYTEDSADYQDVLDRLLVKWATARDLVPTPVFEHQTFAKAAILTIGSADGAAREAIELLQDEDGLALSYCRVRAFPFNDDVRKFILLYDTIYVIEQNRDAQLRTLLLQDLDVDANKLVPALFYDGMPIDAPRIAAAIRHHHRKTAAA